MRRTIFRAPAQNVDELRAALSGGSFGKGSTAEQAEASALMEAIERYSGIFQGDEIRITKRFTDFAPGDAIAPNDVLLFSEAQSRPDSQTDDRRQYAAQRRIPSIRRPGSSGRRSGRCATDASNIFRPASCIFSTAAPPLSRRIPTAAPPAIRSRKPSSRASSNWWSAMPTRSGGTTDRSGPRSISASSTIPTSAICIAQLADTGRKLWVLDVTSDLGVPTYVAILHWMQNGQENIEFGSGAHFDKRIALLRTLTELNQFMSIGHDERRHRRETKPRRRHAVAHRGLSVSDRRAASRSIRRSRSKAAARQYPRSGRSPASRSPGAPASISSSSTRPGPTSRFRWSG